MPKSEPQFLRVSAIVKLTGLTRNRVRELVDTGQLPAFRTGGGKQGIGHRKVHKDAVAAFLKRMGAEPAESTSDKDEEEAAA